MAFAHRIACYVCDRIFQPRYMARLHGDDNAQRSQIAIRRREEANRHPLDLNDESRICNTCNWSILDEIRAIEENPACLRLNVLRQTSSSSCLVCNHALDIHRLSIECRVDIFVQRNIYVPENTRACFQHLDESGRLLNPLMEALQYINRPYVMHANQLNNFLQGMRNAFIATTKHRYSDESDFSDDEFQCMTSLTKEQFCNLYTFCDPIRAGNQNRYVAKKDLLTFLCKLHQGLPDEFLKIIFQYSTRQLVSSVISIVRQSLMLRFVPNNIGFNSITRHDFIERHVTDFSNILYNSNPDERKAIICIDGTYLSIEKSGNFRVLRQSYCLHKGYHLIKPALLVAPDGYILAIHGPYFSDSQNNDAAMLRNEFERDTERMREWFRQGDIVLVDRGYRDATQYLEGLGIVYKMPSFIQRGERQLSTEEANSSRLVTKSRWINESRNGHIKTIFKFFDQNIPTPHLPNIRQFLLIAGALINTYRDPIHMQVANPELAERMLQRTQEPNVVMTRVEVDNLRNKNGLWIRLNANLVPDFPQLTLETIRDLCFGVYQVNLSPSYVQDKLQRENLDEFQLDQLRDEPNFIRVRIYSRFRNATKHQLWICYNDDNDNNEPPIIGYYCTCKTGARTVGTCSHIASVIWFLDFARHQENIKYPSTSLLHQIFDAGNRPLPAGNPGVEIV